jgi:Terminase large subunit, T4likevirus-type, N-terminal/Terminase RNaseH-like domain
MTLTPAQRAFVTSPDAYPAFVGGFGSGKTAAGIARAMRLKIMCREQDIAYYLPTYPLVEDIALRRFPELCERKGWAYKIRGGGSPHIDFPGAGRILFRTMEHPHRIVGYEVAHSIVDELDTLPINKAREAWNKIIARNRQKCGMANSVAVATTPEGFRFVYDRWVKNKAAGYTLFRACTSDNAAHLPDDYIANLQASYPANLLAAYLDGEFVNLTAGSVYAEFDRMLNASAVIIQPGEPLHIGMDFNVGQMSAAVIVMRDGQPHAVDELTGLLDTPAMIAAIRSRYDGHAIYIYPDASGGNRKSNNASESDLSLLRAARFTVLVAPSNPAIKDRVLSVNQMIHSEGVRRFKVNVDRCPMLVEGLEKQAYDKNGDPDKTSGLDHLNDALGYCLFYKFPVRGRAMQHVTLGGL